MLGLNNFKTRCAAIFIVTTSMLFISANASSAVMKPYMDIQLTAGDIGVESIGDSFSIDASVLGIELEGGGFADFDPNEPFALSASLNSGEGELQVGISGAILYASFDNLTVTDLGAGYGSFMADLSYLSGSLSLIDGRIEGTYGPSNLAAKLGAVVPVPAAVWLFGSGLIGLIAVARRKLT
jgi:hypothetical protein